jgi:hypothetical protein
LRECLTALLRFSPFYCTALFFLSNLSIDIFMKNLLTFLLCFNAVHKKTALMHLDAQCCYLADDRTPEVQKDREDGCFDTQRRVSLLVRPEARIFAVRIQFRCQTSLPFSVGRIKTTDRVITLEISHDTKRADRGLEEGLGRKSPLAGC